MNSKKTVPSPAKRTLSRIKRLSKIKTSNDKVKDMLVIEKETNVSNEDSEIADEDFMKNIRNNLEVRKSARMKPKKTVPSPAKRTLSGIERQSKIKTSNELRKSARLSSKETVPSPAKRILSKIDRQPKTKTSNAKVKELLLIENETSVINEDSKIAVEDVMKNIKNSFELRRSDRVSSVKTFASSQVNHSSIKTSKTGPFKALKNNSPKNKITKIDSEKDVLKKQKESFTCIQRQKLKINENNGSTHSTQHYKPKLPIWNTKQETAILHNSLTMPKRSSKRLSGLKNNEIYNFSSDLSPEKKCKNAHSVCSEVGVGKGKKPPKRRRPAIKKSKKSYKGILKPVLLTTDLTWETLLSKNFPVKTFYSKQISKSPSVDVLKSSLIPLEHVETESHFFDDAAVDDAGYEASVSMADDTNDTTISSVNSSERNENYAHIPSYGIGLTFPTPKLTSRYLGTTSTPRGDGMENETMSKPECVQEEMKICFGFDDAEECNFGFSPVQRSHYMLAHHISDYLSSDVGDIDPQPTRFAAPLKPNFRYPLSQVQNLQNKKKHAPSWNNIKFKKKSMIANHNKTPAAFAISQHDNSTLFNCIDENSMEGSESEVVPQINRRKDNQINPVMPILSPAKNFVKPPRKSYTRESIVEVKRKFYANLAGGYSTADSETEADEDVGKKTTKRKKKVKSLKSALSSNSAVLPQQKYSNGKENKLLKNKSLQTNKSQSGSESSIDEWASDVNNHFSEVEEMALVVE